MKARQYAEAIHLASQDKDEAGIEAVALNLHTLLEKRGHLRLLPTIVHELEKIHAQRKDPNTVEVHVARDEDVAALRDKIEVDKQALEATEHNQSVFIDETLVGGYEVRANGTRIDRTHKHALLTLYNNLITNT